MTDSDSDGPHEQEIVEFELIGNRHPNHDMNTMVELTSFQSLGRMQPFTVTMSSSAMAMIDIHAHLTTSEVVGYLAGQWDVTNHMQTSGNCHAFVMTTNLIVSHALPVRCRLGDGEKGRVVEQALYAEMEKLNLSLVGWYHSHPFSPPLPSLRDIDAQLEYELKMKGSNDASYTPCIGIIISPYVRGGGQGTTTSGFWVMPPPEHKPQEYGRPMSIQFTIVQDAFIPKDALYHVRDTVKYYKDCPDSVVFTDIFQDRFTYWDKLKTAIRMCVPKDHYAPLLDYLAKLLELKNYVPEPTGPSTKLKSSAPVPKLQALAEGTPAESAISTIVPSSVIKNRISLETGGGIIVPDVSIVPDVLKLSQPPGKVCAESSEAVLVLESQPPVQPMEVSIPEAEKSPRIDSQQGQNESKQPQPKLEEYQQPPAYQQRSPPPYKQPQQERVYKEQNQDSEVQQEFIQEKEYDQHQQFQQQKQYQQHIEEYQGQQKCDEEIREEYREPPPSYHQQHFTIPTGYIHEEPKAAHPLEDRAPIPEKPQTEEESRATPRYHENLPLDPWGIRRQSDPPHQSDARELEVIQPMDMGDQS